MELAENHMVCVVDGAAELLLGICRVGILQIVFKMEVLYLRAISFVCPHEKSLLLQKPHPVFLRFTIIINIIGLKKYNISAPLRFQPTFYYFLYTLKF